MKKRSNIYTILIVFLLLTQQIISGCTTTVTKDIQKDEFTKEDGRKEELVREKLAKEELLAKEKLAKEKLHMEEDLFGQYLYKFICTACHPLPETDDYDYTPEEWSAIADSMYDTMEHRKLITLKEIEKIKDHLKNKLAKEELKKNEDDLFGHYLYRFICTACHPLPETDDYDYTPEEWSEIADSMYDTMEHRKLITLKEIEKIKDHLKNKLAKEELKKNEDELFGHYLYRFICTACHPLPETDDYDYTPEEWSEIADSMYDSMEHRKLITLKEIEKIKDYLKNKSQKQ